MGAMSFSRAKPRRRRYIGKSSSKISATLDRTAAASLRFDSNGRTIWIADAHGYGKRFIVSADEILTAFVELERAIHQFAVSLIS
jgi:hypothetical protein